jgi:hypothetical protein
MRSETEAPPKGVSGLTKWEGGKEVSRITEGVSWAANPSPNSKLKVSLGTFLRVTKMAVNGATYAIQGGHFFDAFSILISHL